MKVRRHKNSVHELSRPISVEKITATGVIEHIVASPSERKALAERFGFGEIRSLTAELDIKLERNQMVGITGHVEGEVVQSCVVTLDPVVSKVRDVLDVIYAPEHLIRERSGDASAGSEDEESPEPIIGGEIDLGELVAQHFALAVDPYPRKPGAELPESDRDVGEDYVENDKPLAGLDKLKERFGKK